MTRYPKIKKGIEMKKHTKTTGILLLFAVVVTLAVTVLASSYDSSKDPLISLSYLTDTFRPSLEREFTDKIEALEKKIDSMASSVPASGSSQETTGYEVVFLHAGDCLYAASACDIMLRSGSAVCIAPDATQGIADYTDAAELLNGENLIINHMCLIPRADGRGIRAVTDIYILVQGAYTIVNG